MSFQTSQANLVDALKQLRLRWARVRERWDDPRSAEIQREFIDALDPIVRAAISAVDHVAELSAQARRDCSDDE